MIMDVIGVGGRASGRSAPRRGAAVPLLAALALAVPPVQPAPAPAATVEVYYAPEDLPIERLVGLYERAHRYIYVAVYGLTFPPAVKALVEARKRGVDVRLITDRERLDDPKQRAALDTLRLAGIPIKINRHDGLMHMKQVVVDDEVNVTGSANQTGSANRWNDERLDIITDRAVTAKAKDKFLAMWKDQVRYHDWR